jgi:hypothetical protein
MAVAEEIGGAVEVEGVGGVEMEGGGHGGFSHRSESESRAGLAQG